MQGKAVNNSLFSCEDSTLTAPMLESRIYKREHLINALREFSAGLARSKPPKQEKIKGSDKEDCFAFVIGLLFTLVGVIVLLVQNRGDGESAVSVAGIPIIILGVMVLYASFWRSVERGRKLRTLIEKERAEHQQKLKEYRKQLVKESREKAAIKREIQRINTCIEEERAMLEEMYANENEEEAQIDFSVFHDALDMEEKELLARISWTGRVVQKIESYCQAPISAELNGCKQKA